MHSINLITLVALMDRCTHLYLWNPRAAEEEELTPYDVARLGHRMVSRIAVYDNSKTILYLREEESALPALAASCCSFFP